MSNLTFVVVFVLITASHNACDAAAHQFPELERGADGFEVHSSKQWTSVNSRLPNVIFDDNYGNNIYNDDADVRASPGRGESHDFRTIPYLVLNFSHKLL